MPSLSAQARGTSSRRGRTSPGVEWLWLTRPHRTVVVLHAVGDIDELTTPRLAEALLPRLDSFVATVVVDLSQASFLGMSALELLVRSRHRAHVRGVDFWLVTGPRCVDRILEVTGLRARFRTAGTVAGALDGT